MKKSFLLLSGFLSFYLILLTGIFFYNNQHKASIPKEEPLKETVEFEEAAPVIEKIAPPIEIEKTVSMVFAGDVIPHGSVLSAAKYDNGYDFSKALSPVFSIIKDADLAVVNLETPVVKDKAPSGYPLFNAPAELIDGLKASGFDILNTTNNHSLDKRREGLIKTTDEILSKNLIQLGGKDNSGKNYRIVEVNGIKFAFSSYTFMYNGMDASLPPDDPLLSRYNEKRAGEDFVQMKGENPDFFICFIHWGDEYRTSPNESQQAAAKFLADLGYDLIVGMHPHVIQPIDEIKTEEKTVSVAYSLGNFISGQRREKLRTALTEDGLILKCLFLKKGELKSVKASPVPLWVCAINDQGKKRYSVIPCEDYINGKIPLDLSESQKAEVKSSLERTRKILGN